jgi:ABC-type bacteriocin/lantibiotic exporter with double-glycine peptidase domain
MYGCLLSICLLTLPVNQQATISSDNACGPRSIQFLLQYYQQPPSSIFTIVRECELNLEKGMSLSQMCKELQRRNIAARAVELPRGALIASPSPSILLLPPSDKRTEIGHYVVLLPQTASNGMVLTWWGLEGYRWIHPEELVGMKCGHVVITAQDELRLSEARLARFDLSPALVVIFASGLFLISAVAGHRVTARVGSQKGVRI